MQARRLHFIRLLLLFCFLSQHLAGQDALHLELFANYNRGDERYSGSWVYVGPDGREYALLGAKTGTAVYTIDDPAAVEEVGFIAGPSSNWREIIVLGDYAYVTTEGTGPGQGMQVIDLTQLPDAVNLAATYTATFTRGHIIQKDIFEESPYVYVIGTDSTGGVHILDVSDPINPLEVGLYNPGYYIHDCHVRGNRLYACAFYQKTVDIVDLSDPTQPQLITTIPDPGANTHSVSTTLAEDYLFLADEQDGQPGRIFNIEDIGNIIPVSIYTANYESLVHNPYIKGDLVTISHNTEGLRLLDIKDPSLPVEIAYYDTFEGPSGGFSGLWSACPYLPSGKIIGGDRTQGLFVWEHTGPKAGRFYGQVVDSLTGAALPAALVILDNPADTLALDNAAAFKFGRLPGNYTLTVSHPGYTDKLVTIVLDAEAQESLLIELASPISGSTPQPAADSGFVLLSNPVTTQLEISLPAGHVGGQLQVVSEKGQVIYAEWIRKQNWSLDIGDWPAGWYVVSYRTSDGQQLQGQPFLKN